MRKLIVAITFMLACFVAGAQSHSHWHVGIRTHYSYPRGFYERPHAYYYYPSIDCYYDSVTGEYVYYEGGEWVTSYMLPWRYRDYNIRTAPRRQITVNATFFKRHHRH